MRRTTALASCLGLVLLPTGCAAGGAAGERDAGPAALRWESAGEAEVPTGVSAPVRVQLHAGTRDHDAGGVRQRVELLDQHVRADLDGDSAQDAVGLLRVHRFGARRDTRPGRPADHAGQPFARTTTALIVFRNDHGLAVPSRNALPLPTDGQVPQLAVAARTIRVTTWRGGRPVTRTARYHGGALRWLAAGPPEPAGWP